MYYKYNYKNNLLTRKDVVHCIWIKIVVIYCAARIFISNKLLATYKPILKKKKFFKDRLSKILYLIVIKFLFH